MPSDYGNFRTAQAPGLPSPVPWHFPLGSTPHPTPLGQSATASFLIQMPEGCSPSVQVQGALSTLSPQSAPWILRIYFQDSGDSRDL